jgi:hypothetical protein
MPESNRERITRFVKWLEDKKLPESGDDEEIRILAESFLSQYKAFPLTCDQIVILYQVYQLDKKEMERWNKR